MKIVHFAVAALLSLGSAVIAAEPAVAMPAAAAPVAVSQKADAVQVRHREPRRHWRHNGWRQERRHWRPWRAERRHWREQRHWRHHQRPHRGVYFRAYL